MNKRFEVLDSFRGIFALMIVIHHFLVVDSFREHAFFLGASQFVEFFFVLSGFVLAHSYAYKQDLSFRSFAISRTFRIVPLHVVMLGVFILFECAKLIAGSHGITFNEPAFTNRGAVREILPNLFLIHSWTPYFRADSFNNPSWSISIEFYAYMIFFLTIVIFRKNKEIAWTVLSLTAVLLYMTATQFPVFMVKRGIAGFFLGTIVYQFYRKWGHTEISSTIATIAETASILAVIAVVSLNKMIYFPLVLLTFALSIIVFSYEKGFFSKLLKMRFPLYLGKLSYSIYLTHRAILYVVLFGAIIIQKKTGVALTVMQGKERYFDLGNPILNNLSILAVMGITILVSGITYKFIELKGQEIGRKLIKKR